MYYKELNCGCQRGWAGLIHSKCHGMPCALAYNHQAAGWGARPVDVHGDPLIFFGLLATVGFSDGMGISARGAMDMSHVHSRC